jgi:hypothetical protein
MPILTALAVTILQLSKKILCLADELWLDNLPEDMLHVALIVKYLQKAHKIEVKIQKCSGVMPKILK